MALGDAWARSHCTVLSATSFDIIATIILNDTTAPNSCPIQSVAECQERPTHAGLNAIKIPSGIPCNS